MNNRLCCNRVQRRRTIEMRRFLIYFTLCVIGGLVGVPRSSAGDAPGWMHALVNAPLPAPDDKTHVGLLYSARTVTGHAADKIRAPGREAYKIFRPAGREHAEARTSLHR